MVSMQPPLGRVMLELEYATALERHTLRLHARQVEPAPFGPDNDFRYVTPNTDSAAETTLRATLAVLAAVWAGYYSADWHLALRTVWGLDAGGWTPFASRPVLGPIPGTFEVLQAAGDPTHQRVFHLTSSQANRRRLWLRQLARGIVMPTVLVTRTSGGVDDRDIVLVDYLSGTTTGLVAPDGTPFVPSAAVRAWWDQPRAFPWTADALAEDVTARLLPPPSGP